MEEMQQDNETAKQPKDYAIISLVLGIIGAVAWLLPIIGFPVTIIGLVLGIKSLKDPKRGMAIVGIVLCAIFLAVTAINSIIGAYEGATGQLGEPTAIMTERWNTSDVNIETNGNIAVAAQLLANTQPDELKQNITEPDPALVMKAPWEYYGKPIKVTGYVSIVQDYPPNSDIANAINNGNTVGEIVFIPDNAANSITILDYLHLGSTGDIKVGDHVAVYGYAVGLADVENKLGALLRSWLL